jgi:DNA-binding IclR family transcriptional regulator
MTEMRAETINEEILQQLQSQGGSLTIGELMVCARKPYELVKRAVESLEARKLVKKDETGKIPTIKIVRKSIFA